LRLISGSEPGHLGRQGGVLPGQVFMHWFGKVFEGGVEKYEVVRFFAHEIAHLYQGDNHYSRNQADYWIHEGAADLMASILLQEHLPEAAAYVDEFWLDAKSKYLQQLGSRISANSGRSREKTRCVVFMWAVVKSCNTR